MEFRPGRRASLDGNSGSEAGLLNLYEPGDGEREKLVGSVGKKVNVIRMGDYWGLRKGTIHPGGDKKKRREAKRLERKEESILCFCPRNLEFDW